MKFDNPEEAGQKSWRRDPIGAGLKILGHRNKRALAQHMTRTNLFALEVDEFEDQLRSSGASEKMIAQEVEEFRKHKAEMEEPRKALKKKSEERKKRAVQHLDEYVEAEIRRVSGVVADEVLEGMANDG